MNDKSAAAETHSLPAGEARDHHELARDVSEMRGEHRVLKWACGLALVALLGGMGALYQHQRELGRNIREVREDVGRIDERTIHMGKRLDGFDSRLGNVEELLRVLVARTTSNS